MPKSLPWFAFYPSDWLDDLVVMTMPLVQQGAYIRLLCLAARNDGIPSNPLPLLGNETAAWQEPLISCWTPHPTKPGWLHNKRLFAELTKADARRAAGTKAINARWDKELIRPYYDRNTREVLVDERRVEKRTEPGLTPLGKPLLRSLTEIESNMRANGARKPET